jgi:hypothetical protein
MARCSRGQIDDASVGLAIYAIFCCGIIVCLALGFYELMQPRRFANPGLAAYKAPPSAIVNLVDLAAPAPPPELITASIEPPELTTASIEPPAQTPDISASRQRQTKPKTAPARGARETAARPDDGLCIPAVLRQLSVLLAAIRACNLSPP